MGLFDVRCALSGIWTNWLSWAPAPEISMFLVEDVGGRWVPWTPPVRGGYNGYGTLELFAEHSSPYTEWVGQGLQRAFDDGRLVTTAARDLQHERGRVSTVERFLKHSAQIAFDRAKLTIDGRACGACIVFDAIAERVAAAERTSASSSNATLTLDQWLSDGSGREIFRDPPNEGHALLRTYARLAPYVSRTTGWAPITHDQGRQATEDDMHESLRHAWKRGQPLSSIVAALEPGSIPN